MALTLLLPVLACLQIPPRPASPADVASLKPLLTVSPDYSTYRVGDSVTFTCLTPKGHQAMQFQFLRDGAEVDSPETQSQLPYTYNLPSLNVHDSGSYHCRYWTHGQKILSKLSDPITLNVYDEASLKPLLTVSPDYSTYRVGDSVTFTCLTPKGHQAMQFQFLRDGAEVDSPETQSQLPDTYNLPSLNVHDSGSYHCRYWTDGQKIPSKLSDPITLNVYDRLPAPTLSLYPRYTVYLPGERVTLTCSAPGRELPSGYRFFYQGQQDPSVVQHPNDSARLEVTAEKGNAGTYTCAYSRWESNREISSGNSNSVSITVTDRPSAPRLSLYPRYTVYLPGERVTLTCSAPGDELASGYRFFYQGQQEPSVVQPPNEDARLVLTAEKGNAGIYTCAYWRQESNREISSRNSNSVSIPVTDRPSAPTLSVYPRYTVYLPGKRVTLTCSAPGDELASGYRFFYQGQQDPSVVQHPNDSTWLEVTAEKGNAGTYTCAYWRWESNREISSRNSNSVSITVTDRPPAPTLSRDPEYTVYLPGERVTLMCSAPGSELDWRYRFFYQGQQDPSVVQHPNEDARLVLTAEKGNAGIYTCAYWRQESNREISSRNSNSVSIPVTDPFPAPQLTLSPQQPVYVTGETVTLTCSAAGMLTMSGFRFFRDGQKIQSKELPSPWYSYTESIRLSGVVMLDAGAYSCEYWRRVSGREISSVRSQPISIALTDPPPQPVLRLDPPSGAVSEGLTLLITCAVSWDARERRFHFYKDGVELIPGDMGSEINTMESGTDSMNVSVLSIPQASPNNTGEFTCGYEENVGGRWVPSPRSQAVTVTRNITVSAPSFLWVQKLVVGGSFFLINGLIFLISHCCF
ncbi:immunoglobulin superfamily member 1-like [Emys orbicularis]|uniref:immunoglobulin superfamily member 1-like n=1 Tax=Emys orbicularis TaxID=82168 RepID=UPI0031FBD565